MEPINKIVLINIFCIYFLGNFLLFSKIYLLDLATRSNSSFFLIAKLLELPLAAFIISSAKHSGMVFKFPKAAFLEPVTINQMAWLTRRIGDTSQAWRLTEPARPILVESSRGPPFIMAETKTCTGFSPV